MMNVILDTNILRDDPSRSKLPFRALTKLCKGKAVTVHIPYVVKREYETQQAEFHLTELNNAAKAAASLLRRGCLSPETRDHVTQLQKQIEGAKAIVPEDAAGSLERWAQEAGAIVYPLTEKESLAAMESYFVGSSPLLNPKCREDIPDAFIFQTVRTICSDLKDCVFVSNDGKLASAAKELDGINVFRSLDDFISSDDVQSELLELDATENPSLFAQRFRDLAKAGIFNDAIGSAACEKLVGMIICSEDIPDDNNEATIDMYSEPEYVHFDFDSISYFGNGEWGVPFEFSTEVLATFYIFKSDYYCMPEDIAPGVIDHNDHYFEAQDEFQIHVSGEAKFVVLPSDINAITLDSAKHEIAQGVDDIYDVIIEG